MINDFIRSIKVDRQDNLQWMLIPLTNQIERWRTDKWREKFQNWLTGHSRIVLSQFNLSCASFNYGTSCRSLAHHLSSLNHLPLTNVSFVRTVENANSKTWNTRKRWPTKMTTASPKSMSLLRKRFQEILKNIINSFYRSNNDCDSAKRFDVLSVFSVQL